jgi:hypothetical protein
MPPIAERPAGAPGGEPSAPPPRRRRPAALWLVPLGATGIFMMLAWKACWSSLDVGRPDPSWEADAFVVSGEFRADGSCSVLLDGHPVAAVDTPRTEYEHDHATGMTPEGLSVHQVSCHVAAPFKAGAPYDPRSFWVWGPVPTGEPLRPGRYRVVEEALEPGDTTAMEMALFHPRFEDQPKRAYLVGYRGYVRITRVDSPTVVGTFRMVARRKRRSVIE